MSLTIRNADADQLVRLGDVLDALYTFRQEIAQSLSDATLLESSEWINGQGYRPANPSEVVANVQSLVLEEVDYFAQNLLSEVAV
jgi:hypothetical protein